MCPKFKRRINYPILIIVFLIFVNCESEKAELNKIDNYLIENYSIDKDYLYKKYNENSKSLSISGILIYFLADSVNKDYFCKEIDKLKNQNVLDDAYLLVAESRLVFLSGNKERARQLLERAIEKDSSNHWALFELSNQSEIESEKINSLEKAIQLKSNFYRAKVYNAFLLDVTQHPKKIKELLMPLNENNDDVRIYNLLAEANYYLNEFDEAKRNYEISNSLKSNVDALIGLGTIYFNQEDNMKAKEFLVEAYKLDSSNISVLSSLGWFFFNMNKMDSAEYYLNRVTAQAAKLDEIELTDLVDFYLQIGDLEIAQSLVDTLKARFMLNYIIEGYDLIVNYLVQGGEERAIFLDLYKNKYGDEAMNWLTSKLDRLQIDITPKIKAVQSQSS